MTALSNLVMHFIYGSAFMSVGLFAGQIMGRTAEIKKRNLEFILQEIKRLAVMTKDFPHRCTWVCQVCFEERADALISVAKYSAADGAMTINIKYCNDKKGCVDKAHSMGYWYGEPVSLIKD